MQHMAPPFVTLSSNTRSSYTRSARTNLCRLFIICLLVTCTRAQRVGFDVPEFARNRLFWISSDWPVTRYLENRNIGKPETALIIEHVSRVENAVLEALRTRAAPSQDDPLRVCNSDNQNWRNAADNHFGRRGFQDPSRDCITDFFGTKVAADDDPPFSADELFEAVLRRALAINREVKNITDIVLGNWTEPRLMHRSVHDRLSQQCAVYPVGTVREQGYWHVMTSITNAPQYEQLPNFERQYLIEYMRLEDDEHYAKPPLMRIPRRGSDTVKSINMTNATTSLGSWRGAAGGSVYGATFPEDNPAIQASLDATDLYVQQAEDAMTPSGIAILVLPLFFNMVPVALLADVSGLTMLLYILMSDILTAIPLGIKGVELISISKRTGRTVVLRISSSMNGTAGVAAAAELWAAECNIKNSVRLTGIVFVVLAVVCMIFGVFVEFAARGLVKKRVISRKKLLMRKRRTEDWDGSSINSDKVGVPDNILDIDISDYGATKQRRE